MGLISRNLSPESLEAVATHYFSPELTLRANDLILKHSDRLPVIDLFRNQSNLVHTGSDGQKIDVSIPSLRASASFKYFGDGKGITIYSHLDEAGQLIYSTVFSASEREAPYVLDALSHDEVISSDVHSTAPAARRHPRLYRGSGGDYRHLGDRVAAKAGIHPQTPTLLHRCRLNF